MADLLGIGQAIGGAIQGVTNVWSTKKNIDANREMAQYQYSKDLEMWNRQNEYNSPQNQYNRLEGTGINPVTAFSKGSFQNTAKEMPKYQAPTLDHRVDLGTQNIPAMIGAFQDLELKNAQIDNAKSQNQSIELENALKNFQRILWSKTMPEREQQLFYDAMQSANKAWSLERENRYGDEMYDTKIGLDSELSKYQTRNLKLGIAPNTPWWGKIAGDWFNKMLKGNPFKKIDKVQSDYQKNRTDNYGI